MRILRTRIAFVVVGWGTRHTLASYLSRHNVPATTASGAHRTGSAGKPAAALEAVIASPPTIRATVAVLRFIVTPRFIFAAIDRSCCRVVLRTSSNLCERGCGRLSPHAQCACGLFQDRRSADRWPTSHQLWFAEHRKGLLQRLHAGESQVRGSGSDAAELVGQGGDALAVAVRLLRRSGIGNRVAAQ